MYGIGSRTWTRWAAGVAGAVVLAGSPLAAGSAYADETHRDSHNAPRVALITTGQIDDPAEDVLEHLSFWHVVND